MSKLLATTSRGALLTGADPSPADPNYVRLEIAYDCFNIEQRDKHELQWRPEATLADYLKGLPADCEWLIYINGTEVSLEENGEDTLCQLDEIALILVPQGSGAMKSIMRVALMAVSVAVAFIPGMQWWAAAGIAIAAGLVNTFLMAPKVKSGESEDKTYGIDGPKNSATENIPYPVIYGEFRFGGNLADCYTVNVGDDQYLYLRTVLNDGEVDDITDIELNEQPIANFKDVQYRIKKGTLEENINDWFSNSIVQVHKGITLNTTWTVHETGGDVDRLRLDLTFPEGLTNVNLKKGTKGSLSVELALEYRLKGTTTWNPLPMRTGTSTGTGTGAPGAGYGSGVQVTGSSVSLQVRAPALDTKTTAAAVTATNVGTGQVHELGVIAPTEEELQGINFDAANDGTIAGSTDAKPLINRSFTAELPEGTYNVAVSNGEIVDATASTGSANDPSNGSGLVTFTDRRAVPFRKSIESGTLPRGTYEVRIRRTAAEDDREDRLDTIILTDVAEIDNTPVALRGTANLSIRIRLSDQLNAIPTVTAKVRGSLCRRYDNEGNVLDQVWTANNAWQALDILLSPERGATVDPSRIDWPRWVEYAQWCDANNVQWNGAFAESNGNVGDAVREVLRIGQAALIPFGRKISVAVDRARDPVHVFTNASILKDSFQISYLSMADRANEYEFSYFDKNDRNKQKTIRYVDPKAVTFNEIPRAAQVTLAGVDNIDQAKREMWKAIYQNRLLIRRVEFESWLDSINMAIGETALIQHDMMEWAKSGRLEAGNTTTKLNLDQKVSLPITDLAVNGTFDVNTDGWVAGNDAVLSVVNGRMRVANKAGGGSTGYARQQINTVAGKVYTVSVFAGERLNGARIRVGTTYTGSDLVAIQWLPIEDTATFTFTATGTVAFVQLLTGNSADGSYADFDDVSVEVADAANVLIHFDALNVGVATVNSIVGKKILVEKPAAADFTVDQLNAKRAIINGADYEIVNIVNGSTYHTITLTSEPVAAALDTVELWDTDVLVEKPVSSVAQNADGTSSLTLATALPQAPEQHANFAFGEVSQVRKPYTLVSVSGNGLEKRKLSFVEYHSGVYAEPEIDIPTPVTQVSDRPVSHVRSLSFSYDPIVEANRSMIPVTVKWRSGHILNYGGADVFVSINGEAPQAAGTAVDASHYTVNCKPGDLVEFTVVAFNRRGDRAALPTAPTVVGTVSVQFADLDPPTNLQIADVAFEVDGKVAVNFTKPADMTGVQDFEVQYKRAPDSVWTSVGYYGEGPVEIPGLPTGNYNVRVRSSSTTSTSIWVSGDFLVAVAPGSLMENWNSRNDRNGDPIPAPSLPSVGAVEHTLNSDGSANVSFEWLWGGDEAFIDGFKVEIDSGINLVTNGTFDANTNGWSPTNATLTVNAGRMRATATQSTSPAYAQYSFATEVGKVYRVRAQIINGNAVGMVRVGTGLNSNAYGELTNIAPELTFTATGTTTHLTARTIGTNAIGNYAEFDNISVLSA